MHHHTPGLHTLLSPDRIGTDGAGTYPGAIRAAREEGLLACDPIHYVTKHLQQGIESGHFRVKQPMPKVGGFRSFNTARRSIQGFEAMLWLRKGVASTELVEFWKSRAVGGAPHMAEPAALLGDHRAPW